MENFPSYAKMLDEGFDKSRASVVDRTEMSDGMVKQLQTKSRGLVSRNLMIDFSSLVDYQSFITWYRVNLHGGADWFAWIDPEDDVVKTARIANKLDKEKPLRGPTYWRISAIIETWDS